ncbi:MAG: hypothetical protein WDO24_14540 [Pseudomonadota bacterium]
MNRAGLGLRLEGKNHDISKISHGPSRGWLIGGAAAFGLALMLTGCVVEAGGPAYREHWHGWHEWR